MNRFTHALASATGGAILAVTLAAAPASAAAPSTGVKASYQGATIDLSKGWGGADVCSEDPSGAVSCADVPASSSAEGVAAQSGHITDCPEGWVCLWQFAGAEGRRLQWSAVGTKDLDDWGFRDKATGAMNRRIQYGFELTDERSFMPDPHMYIPAGSYVNLSKESYPFGGTWDNRVDKVAVL